MSYPGVAPALASGWGPPSQIIKQGYTIFNETSSFFIAFMRYLLLALLFNLVTFV